MIADAQLRAAARDVSHGIDREILAANIEIVAHQFAARMLREAARIVSEPSECRAIDALADELERRQ